MLLLVTFGCGSDEAVGPDISGHYNVMVDGINGCDNDPDHVAWMRGPLAIEGEPDALTYDFGDGMVFDGSAQDSGRFSFAGSANSGGVDYSSSGGGTVEGGEGSRHLSGLASATLRDDGDLNCTVDISFTATQIAE